MIAALYVQRDGVYWDLPDVDPWDEERDARLYVGPHPVVAHPPCNLWVNLAAVNWKRYGRQKPAWYPGGNDGGCFQAALNSLEHCGGVLEHPAFTHAWQAHSLPRPPKRETGWFRSAYNWWVCEVWQSAYGHRARKRTWLLYHSPAGIPPAGLNWARNPGQLQIGGGIHTGNNKRPKMGKLEASATPPAFRDVLIHLARHSIHESGKLAV